MPYRYLIRPQILSIRDFLLVMMDSSIQRTITRKDVLTPHLGRRKSAVAANTVPYRSLKIGAVRVCSRIMVSEDKGIGAPSGTVEARSKRYSKTSGS